MEFLDKIAAAVELIQKEITPSTVVMSSFGKDSMVMLDLVRKAGFQLPILFFKEPFFPEKYAFAYAEIIRKGYTVYDYPPLATTLMKANGVFEVINKHQVGGESIGIPTGIIEPEENKPFLCGLQDLLWKPKGTYMFPWDTLFIGHKSSDVDPLRGNVPLKKAVASAAGKKLVFPLKEFTDDDVWRYHEEFSLPIHESRYDKENSFKEHASKDFNPDYFPTCMACVDRDNPDEVYCPKFRMNIPNVSSQIKYEEVSVPDYVGEEN